MNNSMTFLDFEDYLRGQGLAPKTVHIYSSFVRRLLRWCYARGINHNTLTRLQIVDWISDDLPDSWASRRPARTALGHWNTWRGETDPIHEAIRVPRKPKHANRALTIDEASALQATALVVGGNEGLATLLGLYLAARRSEIAGLTWDGYQGGKFRFVRTKVHDVHTVPVHPVLALALDNAKANAHGNYLFPGDRGRPHVSPTTVWEWVVKVGKLADLRVTPHQLRATALTTVLEATGNLRSAQELAGHRDPAVTALYTRVSDQMMVEAVTSLDYEPKGDA